MFERLGVPQEVEDGIVQLLFATAFPEGPSAPYVVVTRDYPLWLARFPNQQMTLLDLSVLIPPDSGWGALTESRLELEVKRQLLAAGWNPEQIVSQYRSGLSSKVADFGLVDYEGRLVAVVEVKAGPPFLGEPMASAIQIAGAHGARYALLTDGKRVSLFDAKSDLTIARHTLPTPREIGIETRPFDLKESAKEQSLISVITATNYPELLANLHKLEGAVFIIDHTMPWGMKLPAPAKDAWNNFFPSVIGTSAFDLVTGKVPEAFTRIALMDFIGALVSLFALKSCTETLITMGPQSLTVSSAFEGLRQSLTKRFRVASIVELPVDLLRPYTAIRSTLLRLDQAISSDRRETYFYSIPSRGELVDVLAQFWFSEFKKGLLGKPTTKGIHTYLRQSAPWSLAGNEPKLKQNEERLSKYAEIVKLGELCEVFQGLKHPREEALAGKGISVVRGRDISAGVDSIMQLGHYRFSGVPSQKTKILLGDILIQRIGTSPTSMVASLGLTEAFASDTVIIIRPKQESADPFLICQFLNSTVGQALLASHAKGTYAPTLAVSAVRTIPIPIFPIEVASGLRELAEIEQTLRTKADKLRSARLDIFSPGPDENPQSRIRDLRQISKAMSASLQQAETLDFQIRNFYPYPVAYAYRTLSGITVHSLLYPEQLRVAENILAFLASLSLALISGVDHDRLGIGLRECWRGGVSPGHWRQIAQKCGEVLSTYTDNQLAQGLSALWRDKTKRGFQKTVDQLIQAMNDFKHHRGPKTEEDFQQSTKQTNIHLRDCLRDLAFLTEYPIRLIRDMSAVRGSRAVSLIALRCTGDHPGLAQDQLTYPEPLTKDDLYIEVHPNGWTSLYPFVVSHTCSQCRNREFYFIDKWKGDSSPATVKSFEQGHTQDLADIGNAMESWQNPDVKTS